MSYMDELNFWLNDDYFDQKTKEELLCSLQLIIVVGFTSCPR